MMDFKYVLKEKDMYWVGCSDTQPYTQSAYPVSELDENCIYTIEQVETYLSEYPEALLDMEMIEEERARTQEITQLKSYLTSTDYIYPKCIELGLDVNTEYAEVVEQRKTTRARIQELEGA